MTADVHSAITFSGGGAYGAFQVGVVEALAAGRSPATGYQPLDADLYTGTSAGAFNAAFLASQWQRPLDQAAALLRKVWIDEISQKDHQWGCGVVRYRANPFKFLNPAVFLRDPVRWGANMMQDGLRIAGGLAHQMQMLWREKRSDPSNAILALFDVSNFTTTRPFDLTLRRTIDYDGLRRSPKELAVVATDWSTGQPRIFGRDEVADRLGTSYLRGSASIPGLFPPVSLEGDLLVDGGVVMNLPLEPAIDAGANVIYAAMVAPRRATNSERVLRSTVGSMLSAQLAGWRYAMKAKLEDIEGLNYLLRREELVRATYGGEAGEMESRILNELHRMKQLLESHLPPGHHGLRQVTVHVFQPEEQLGGGPLGMLDFHHDFLAEHIEAGHREAERHDCDQNGCILAMDVEEAASW